MKAPTRFSCPDHPKYEVVRMPTGTCGKCWDMFFDKIIKNHDDYRTHTIKTALTYAKAKVPAHEEVAHQWINQALRVVNRSMK